MRTTWSSLTQSSQWLALPTGTTLQTTTSTAERQGCTVNSATSPQQHMAGERGPLTVAQQCRVSGARAIGPVGLSHFAAQCWRIYYGVSDTVMRHSTDTLHCMMSCSVENITDSVNHALICCLPGISSVSQHRLIMQTNTCNQYRCPVKR